MRYVQSVIDSNEEAVHSNQYQAYKSLSEAFRGGTYETFYPHKVVIGDPAQCAARIAEIRALGITNISLLADFGGIGQEKILGSMDRFAREVMPRV